MANLHPYPTRQQQVRLAPQDVPRPSRVNWWLRLVSSGWNTPATTIEQRERARRSRLTGWIILAILIICVLLIPSGLNAPATLEAVSGLALGSLIAIAFNRAGLVTAAGAILVLLIMAAILSAIVAVPHSELSLIYLPAYDLFAVAVVVAASILPRGAAFVVAAICIGLIVGDLFLQPHSADVTNAIATYGAASLITRPIALIIVVAAVAYLWVRGTDDAIRRADRAEEIAAMEHTIVEQKRQLDYGIQLILDTHVRAANGDFAARAPLTQDNVLWQIAASLNNLLARLQRSGVAEHQLQRTDEEIRRLAAAIRDAQQGRTPIWPAPTGTSADLLLELIGRGAQPARDPYQAPPPLQAPQQYPQPQLGGYSPDGSYSQPMSNIFPPAGAGGFAPARPPASGELPWQQQQQQQPVPQAPHNPWTSPDEEPR